MLNEKTHWIKNYEGRLVNLAYVQHLGIERTGTIAVPMFEIVARIGEKESMVISRSSSEKTVSEIYQKISALLIRDAGFDFEDPTQSDQGKPFNRPIGTNQGRYK